MYKYSLLVLVAMLRHRLEDTVVNMLENDSEFISWLPVIICFRPLTYE